MKTISIIIVFLVGTYMNSFSMSQGTGGGVCCKAKGTLGGSCQVVSCTGLS